MPRELAQKNWNTGPGGGLAVMMGDPDAESPDCYLLMNTGNHKFFIRDRVEGSTSQYRMAVWGRVDTHPSATEELISAHEGQLRLTQVLGPLGPAEQADSGLMVLVLPSGLVRSTTQRLDGTQSVSDDLPWPGLDIESELLWAPYPEFDEYEDLLGRSRQAFEFFLSGPDPRSSLSQDVAAKGSTASEPFVRATLRVTFDRDAALTSDERATIEGKIAGLGEVRGEGFNLWFPTNEPTTVFYGESELWGEEPIAHIVEDLEAKLAVLTDVRLAVEGGRWDVSIEEVPIEWNKQTQRYDTPD